MPRIRIDDQLSVGYFLGKRERIDGRIQDVIIAIHDKRRLGDGFEFGEPLAAGLTPFGDCRPLRRHCLCRCGDVDVFLPRVPTRPEYLSGRLALRRRAKKQVEIGFLWAFARRWICQTSVFGIFRILRWFTRSWSGADENETADQFGMAYCKR